MSLYTDDYVVVYRVFTHYLSSCDRLTNNLNIKNQLVHENYRVQIWFFVKKTNQKKTKNTTIQNNSRDFMVGVVT